MLTWAMRPSIAPAAPSNALAREAAVQAAGARLVICRWHSTGDERGPARSERPVASLVRAPRRLATGTDRVPAVELALGVLAAQFAAISH